MSGSYQGSENIPGAKGANSDAGGGGDQQTPTVEERAHRMGWRPLNEFRGDPAKWVDAAAFVARGEEQLPILSANLRKSEAAVARLEATVRASQAEQSAMAAQLAEARDAVMDIRGLLSTAETRSYQRAINDINARMDQAIEDGDKDAVKKARSDLAAVTTEMEKRAEKKADPDATKVPPAPQLKPDATAVAWINAEEQAWYRENPDAKGFADGLFDRMKKDPKTASLPMADKLERIRETTAKKFPEYFDGDALDLEPEPQPRQQSKVSTPRGQTQQTGKGRRFEDMPAESQAAFARVSKQIEASIKANSGRGKPLTKEQWAADYFGPEQE